jgi:predicted acylesterase/phospholipase RssA
MAKTWRILSIDGGGIRGLIPATILSAIETQTGKPIHELFDLIAGTSTGAILTLGLTKPDQYGKVEHSARALRDIYERDAPSIFKGPASWWENLLRPKYDSSGMRRVMRGNFGTYRLKDALCDILIPCYDIQYRSPHIFRSRWARRQTQYDFDMADVASAASATPTMFEPVRIPRPGSGGVVSLVDGGVFANNPSGHALAEINTMIPDPTDQILLVSLGTGESMERMERKYPTDWGYIRWSVPMVELVSESISEGVHRQVKDLLPPTDSKRYYRFQVDLPDDTYYALDNIAKPNIRGLIQAAEQLLLDRRTKDDIDDLCKRLLRLNEQENGKGRSRYIQTAKISEQESNTTNATGETATEDIATNKTAARSNSTKPHYSLPSSGYDITICHAEAEGETVAIPLGKALKKKRITPLFVPLGVEGELTIHHVVSQAAETTLITVVILSPALFINERASKQLAWLHSRTVSGENIVIPVVHGFSKNDIKQLSHYLRWHKTPDDYLEYLLTLSAGSTSLGPEKLADRLVEEIVAWIR